MIASSKVSAKREEVEEIDTLMKTTSIPIQCSICSHDILSFFTSKSLWKGKGSPRAVLAVSNTVSKVLFARWWDITKDLALNR